jgi:hypothetical protein
LFAKESFSVLWAGEVHNLNNAVHYSLDPITKLTVGPPRGTNDELKSVLIGVHRTLPAAISQNM